MPAATSLACKGSIATQPSEVVVFVVVVRSRSTHTPRQSRFSDGLPSPDGRRQTYQPKFPETSCRFPPSRDARFFGTSAHFQHVHCSVGVDDLSPPFQDSLRSMAAHRLPNETWLYIFELSTVEYLPNGELPNSMDRSAWFKNVFDAWCLQSPDELVMNAQKKRYKTVKVCCTSLVGARGNLNRRCVHRPSSRLANAGITSPENSCSTTSQSSGHSSCSLYATSWITNLTWAHTLGASTSVVPRCPR